MTLEKAIKEEIRNTILGLLNEKRPWIKGMIQDYVSKAVAKKGYDTQGPTCFEEVVHCSRHGNKWSEFEDSRLEHSFEDLLCEIAKRHGRTPGAMAIRIRRNNLIHTACR